MLHFALGRVRVDYGDVGCLGTTCSSFDAGEWSLVSVLLQYLNFTEGDIR